MGKWYSGALGSKFPTQEDSVHPDLVCGYTGKEHGCFSGSSMPETYTPTLSLLAGPGAWRRQELPLPHLCISCISQTLLNCGLLTDANILIFKFFSKYSLLAVSCLQRGPIPPKWYPELSCSCSVCTMFLRLASARACVKWV